MQRFERNQSNDGRKKRERKQSSSSSSSGWISSAPRSLSPVPPSVLRNWRYKCFLRESGESKESEVRLWPLPPALCVGRTCDIAGWERSLPFNVLILPFTPAPAPGPLSRTKKAAVTMSYPLPWRPVINAAVAATHLLPRLPASLFSSSIRFI